LLAINQVGQKLPFLFILINAKELVINPLDKNSAEKFFLFFEVLQILIITEYSHKKEEELKRACKGF
jgi:hypothetical protein